MNLKDSKLSAWKPKVSSDFFETKVAVRSKSQTLERTFFFSFKIGTANVVIFKESRRKFLSISLYLPFKLNSESNLS